MSKSAHRRAREQPSERPTVGALSVKQPPMEEEIRMRAYYIYLERSGIDGNDVDDWLQAELELRKGV